jgi:hypothetical protein
MRVLVVGVDSVLHLREDDAAVAATMGPFDLVIGDISAAWLDVLMTFDLTGAVPMRLGGVVSSHADRDIVSAMHAAYVKNGGAHPADFGGQAE